MRFQVDEQYGDPQFSGTSADVQSQRESAPDQPGVDPGAPDLSYLETAIASFKQGDPLALREALESFFGTFKQVVMANPNNQIEMATLLRLKELVVKAKSGELPANDPEMLSLAVAVRRNGKAVGAVYKFFLFFDPYGMFDQIRGAGLKAFQPLIGPILVTQGDAVRDLLSRHDEFTVNPYGLEMAKTMSPQFNGAHGGPGLTNFILGTDDDIAYEPDKAMLTQVVNRQDPKRIRPLLSADCRDRIGRAVKTARESGTLQLDIVRTVARFVPVTLGRVYLGAPALTQIEHFELSDEMLRYYGNDLLGGPDGKQILANTGLRRDEGIVADEATMYFWIKTSFECFFNNVTKDVTVQQEGFRSCRLLLCSLLREIQELKQRFSSGAQMARPGRSSGANQVRNTMLSRLVQLQLSGQIQEQRVTDLRIAENVMGTMVGAVAGQEEASCRVIDALLKLKEGVYRTSGASRMRGTFDDARKQALITITPRSTWRSRKAARDKLFHYFRECLRMEPQGEILLRQCKLDGTRLFSSEQQASDPGLSVFAGNRPIRAGELIFAAHGSAMKDITAADEFRLKRPCADETYLFYGYGRHKCLGQYISPVVIVETMIAVLALEGLNRASDFKLDDKNLYARELLVNFSDNGTTREVYPARNT